MAANEKMNRNAFSLVEVTIALVLLTVAAGAVGQFVVQVHQGLKERQLSSAIGWEVDNACERIRSWDVADVTPQNIESIRISEAVKKQLQDADWQAEVTRIAEPIQAKQITLRFQCTLRGQSAEPEKVTLWLADEQQDEADAL